MNDGSRPKAASTSFAGDDNSNGTGPSAAARAFTWAVDRPFEVAAGLALVAALAVGGLR